MPNRGLRIDHVSGAIQRLGFGVIGPRAARQSHVDGTPREPTPAPHRRPVAGAEGSRVPCDTLLCA